LRTPITNPQDHLVKIVKNVDARVSATVARDVNVDPDAVNRISPPKLVVLTEEPQISDPRAVDPRVVLTEEFQASGLRHTVDPLRIDHHASDRLIATILQIEILDIKRLSASLIKTKMENWTRKKEKQLESISNKG
tara:strand:- start:202 stop:609 length:408 start_codon:yes stop_codon:yes gene_type:complete